ncbi:RNA-guided endonuclease InsQ/TnpB family protein [Allocoleopsis franciscana]|uniref:Transposase, IS605 OrfB family, central region n=1 Tax=Allocoleopsis franciscana PCC 7113 TaxID=1173027 RepID=K9WPS7_9CYAN|nr:RNA-guided endonuclease TnpB family protein [Allocoleopsis franciscana]AFZ21547.1 transposase, IS605 OrfB family, central region [Allocoleopsis franciscana PCC 7113]
MLHKAVKVRLYPTALQQVLLSQHFGCARWWWNYALNKSIETYKETGKSLNQSALNAFLPKLKKAEETIWLSECYSQVLQATTLNLTTAYKNFFAGRARFPRYKSKHGKQSLQYPQNVKVLDGFVQLPGKVGKVKAKLHRNIEGTIKTVTVSLDPSGKYFASILTESEGDNPTVSTNGKVIGVDLGLTHFAITSDGCKVSKYDNPRHLVKHEKNLKRKQQKLAKKQKGSNSRNKVKKTVAKVYERVTKSRQDFLHKLSRKLVNENQVVVVENLNVKGMVRNHNLAKAISDIGWGTFVNFLFYKLEKKGGKLVEIDRWFPSSRLCSNCYYQIDSLSLDIREWTCPNCGTRHDRDGNAATNIRAEGIRMLQTDGTAVSANGGEVRPKLGRKSVLRHSPVMLEAHTIIASI